MAAQGTVETLADRRAGESHGADAGAEVLLTGVTGFVGKVVLAEVLRRRDELGVRRVHVLVRPKRGQTAGQRVRALFASPAFRELAPGWHQLVHVVPGELTAPDLGATPHHVAELEASVTHVLHCAASVEFDLPICDAADQNIRAALNVLELARRMRRLARMVSVSTAYVTPHRPGSLPVEERLAPLPEPPEAYWRRLAARDVPDVIAAGWLAETGHPNTYTFTKCLAEHLLVARRGDVPLSIVRPSIVSAAWRHPFPGWIDSQAAFAAFVALIGSGWLRHIVADPATRLDIVPVDVVSDAILAEGFSPESRPADAPSTSGTPVVHAVAGLDRTVRIDTISRLITDYFGAHPVMRPAKVRHLGALGPRFRAGALAEHHAPLALGELVAKARRDGRGSRRANRMRERLVAVNQAFPYFTHSTFDFQSSRPFDADGFKAKAYVETVCRGCHQHLLGGDPRAVPLAGRKPVGDGSDLAFARRGQAKSMTTRAFGYVLRKASKRAFDQVTFDRDAFVAALDAIPPHVEHLVLVPSHRSYADFLLVSYLCFARPDLGLELPAIAAAEEFSRLPGLSHVLKTSGAFWLKRGQGREDAELTRRVRDLVEQGRTLQFFVEGARSRTRRFLTPKRGLLRCLQATGESFALLPIPIAYDRVPEEGLFLEELRGAPKPAMSVAGLARWSTRLARGEVQLGRAHLGCAAPLLLEPDTDVRQLANDVVVALQRELATTTHHLDAFLATPEGRRLGLDTAALRALLEDRGALVLDSPLDGGEHVPALLERSMRHDWLPVLAHEALTASGHHAAVTRELSGVCAEAPTATGHAPRVPDPTSIAVALAALEAPRRELVCAAEAIAMAVEARATGDEVPSPRRLLTHPLVKGAFLPTVEGAYDAMVEAEVLCAPRRRGGPWTVGARPEQVAVLRSAWSAALDPTAPRARAARSQETGLGAAAR